MKMIQAHPEYITKDYNIPVPSRTEPKRNPMLFSNRIELKINYFIFIELNFLNSHPIFEHVNCEWMTNGKRTEQFSFFFTFILASRLRLNNYQNETKRKREIRLDSWIFHWIFHQNSVSFFTVAVAFNDVVSIGHLTITASIPCALFKLSDKLSSSAIMNPSWHHPKMEIEMEKEKRAILSRFIQLIKFSEFSFPSSVERSHHYISRLCFISVPFDISYIFIFSMLCVDCGGNHCTIQSSKNE